MMYACQWVIVSYFGDSYRSYRLVFGSILQLQLLVFFIKSSNTAKSFIIYMGPSDIFGLLKDPKHPTWCFSNTKLVFTTFKDTMKEWTTFQISVNWNLRSFYLCLCPECKSCGSGAKRQRFTSFWNPARLEDTGVGSRLRPEILICWQTFNN